jgi:tRNA dimethylallyltransferase
VPEAVGKPPRQPREGREDEPGHGDLPPEDRAHAGKEVDVAEPLLRNGDWILLCTDGLTKMVNENDIGRALEVYRVSGQPLSSFHHEKTAVETPPLISLEPTDRAWLHQRIEERFAHMLDAGLVDEVESLMNRGDLHADMPSMRCVGYRQVWEALEAGDQSELPERGIAATRQLGKRQLTWLRSMPQRHVVACDAADAQAQVVALAQQLIAGNAS